MRPLLGLDIEPDGSFVDVGSNDGFMSQQDQEESKRPDLEARSNHDMSAETNRLNLDRGRQTRAIRLRQGTVIERINNYGNVNENQF